jgi:hypothetical protein
MPVKSDDPLRKITLNLYEADCQWFEKEYGRGWTERIRQHIHAEVHKHTSMTYAQWATHRRTLGDFE